MKKYSQKFKKGNSLQLTAAGYLFFLITIILSGCTKKFDDYNTDNTGIATKNLNLPSLFGSFETAIWSNYQRAQNLSADWYSGYMSSGINFGSATNWNYTMRDDWNSTGFNDQYTMIAGPIVNTIEPATRTAQPDLFAVALIIKVIAMDRVADKFGPIAYSKIGTVLNNTPFDSMDTLYNEFFADLDTAVQNLNTYIAANPGKTQLSGYDLIYDGDYKQWLKLANSIRLRLAIHISKVAPQTAEDQVKKALSAQGGLMEQTSDDAAIAQGGGRENDFYQITHDWNNNNVGAPIVCFLTGYKDPRISHYMLAATDSSVAGKYIGIRLGTPLNSTNSKVYANYATPNTQNDTYFSFSSPQLLMTSAEVWFLRAEAALRGWSSEDVQTNYETGIKTSMVQWGITNNTTVNAYIDDAVSTEAPYVDPTQPAYNDDSTSTITIKWDDGATNEQKLERIITQKWIAMYPEGQEAWTEFRRTGYPILFTTAQNTNPAEVSTSVQIRRLPYPSNEYSAENQAIQQAVQLLGGKDNPGTRLWWDTGKSNF